MQTTEVPSAPQDTKCLSLEAIRADIAASATVDEIKAASAAWVSRCPRSSVGWLARAVALQRAGIDQDELLTFSGRALELDSDWGTFSPAAARLFRARIYLSKNDRAAAQAEAKECKGTSPECDQAYRLAGLMRAPSMPTLGPVEQGGAACVAISELPVLPNPAYGYAAQAQALEATGDLAKANVAANNCVWWAKSNAPPPQPSVPGQEVGEECPQPYDVPPADLATLCERLRAASSGVSPTSSAPIEEAAELDTIDTGTVGVGLAFGVSTGFTPLSAGAPIIGGTYSFGVYYVMDRHGSHGFAIQFQASAGGAVGASAFIGGFVQVTNAEYIKDLAGPSNVLAVAGVSVQPWGGSVDVFTTMFNDEGPSYWGLDFAGGFSGGYGASLSTGWSYTYVFPDASSF